MQIACIPGTQVVGLTLEKQQGECISPDFVRKLEKIGNIYYLPHESKIKTK